MSSDERIADPEAIEERMYEALGESDAWSTLDELQYQLTQIQTSDLDVAADVSDHLIEAREEIAHAQLLIRHEVFANVLESLENGGDSRDDG